MRTAYILHGGNLDPAEYLEMDYPSPSNFHWIPWLQQKFLRSGILCQALEMPTPYKPVYEEWSDAFSQAQIKDDTIIVCHSMGSGFILKYLHDNPSIKLKKLVFVAPWLDPTRHFNGFLEFSLLPDPQNRFGEMHVFYSEDEPVNGVAESKDKIMEIYPNAKLHLFTDKRHFCFSDTGATFEELWAVCK